MRRARTRSPSLLAAKCPPLRAASVKRSGRPTSRRCHPPTLPSPTCHKCRSRRALGQASESLLKGPATWMRDRLRSPACGPRRATSHRFRHHSSTCRVRRIRALQALDRSSAAGECFFQALGLSHTDLRLCFLCPPLSRFSLPPSPSLPSYSTLLPPRITSYCMAEALDRKLLDAMLSHLYKDEVREGRLEAQGFWSPSLASQLFVAALTLHPLLAKWCNPLPPTPCLSVHALLCGCASPPAKRGAEEPGSRCLLFRREWGRRG
jgi:hypothetical protein